MQQNNMVETIIGAIVVAVAVVFLVFAYRTTGSGNLSGYTLTATLPRVDGLVTGADVTLSGIKIGTVSDLVLDPATYKVTLSMRIHNDVKIPDDSSLVVNQPLLMGSTTVSIAPGGDDAMLPPGGQIRIVQGSIGAGLPGLIGQFLGGGSSGAQAAPQKPAPLPPMNP